MAHSSSSVVRCAVIGLGMGNGHAKGYMETPEAKLVGVVDMDPNRLKDWSDKLGPDACFTDYKKMLKALKPDLVSIALPNVLHAPVTIDCLRAGAHVLCEKPMAMNMAQALKMEQEAQKAKRKLGLNLSFRFTPQARALKDLCEDGFLGTPYHAHTQWTRRDGFPRFGGWFGQQALSGGGPLIDLGVHRIDLAIWLMGCPEPVSVSGATHSLVGVPRAKAQKLQFDVEDFAAGFIRFNNGVSMTLQISWAGHQAKQEIMSTAITGTQGSVVHRNDDKGFYDFVGEYFHEVHGHKLAGQVIAARSDIRSSYSEMVRAIVHNTRPLADAQDGLRIQRILDGLYKSARLGKEIRLD